jgi:hypothetical protein
LIQQGKSRAASLPRPCLHADPVPQSMSAKSTSSRRRVLALTLSLALPAKALAQAAAAAGAPPGNPPPAGPAAPPAPLSPPELAPDAPDKHVVVPGDTLWGIAGKFLEKPWRWPELWRLNREQIRNPHLIYPGDIVYLDGAGASARLRLARPVDGASAAAGPAQTAAGTGAAPSPATRSVGVSTSQEIASTDAATNPDGSRRLSPRVRAERTGVAPIPTVSSAAIEPFLNRPLILDEQAQREHPRIVGIQEGRVFLGQGELAYVSGLKPGQDATEWYLYRRVTPLVDPDTRRPIAFEAVFLGTARLERRGEPASFRVLRASEEIGPGDRLVPAERVMPMNFAPRAPERTVNGRIVSVYRGVSQAGRNSVVALNLGRRQGIEEGHVVGIRERSRTARDPDSKAPIELPGETIGEVLVFRVFDTIAYGLIVAARKAVAVGDDIVNP